MSNHYTINSTKSHFNMIGGGKCSLCGSEGTTKINCPLNRHAIKPNVNKHPLAVETINHNTTKNTIKIRDDKIEIDVPKKDKEINVKAIRSTIDLNTGLWQRPDEICDNFGPTAQYDREHRCDALWGKKKGIMLKLNASMINPKTTISSDFDSDCEALLQSGPSKQWWEAMDAYIKNLTDEDKKGLGEYSYHGDVVVNNLLRNNIKDAIDELNKTAVFQDWIFQYLTPEDLIPSVKNKYVPGTNLEGYLYYAFNPEAIIVAVGHVINHINKIIENSPPLDKDIVVFRGLNNMDFLKMDETVKVDGFFSTSFDWTVPLDKDFGNNLLAILIPKGFHALPINQLSKFPEEAELLLPKDTKIHLIECVPNKQVVYNPYTQCRGKRYKSINICNALVMD